MNPSLRALIEKHPTLTYKEVFYNDFRLILFYDVQKDDAGHEYFDEFFVTDLQGAVLDLQDDTYEYLKRLV